MGVALVDDDCDWLAARDASNEQQQNSSPDARRGTPRPRTAAATPTLTILSISPGPRDLWSVESRLEREFQRNECRPERGAIALLSDTCLDKTVARDERPARGVQHVGPRVERRESPEQNAFDLLQ